MTSGEVLLVVGGVAAAAAVAAVIVVLVNRSKNASGNANAARQSDFQTEKLVITNVSGNDITDWFRQKNSDGSYQNILMFPTPENLSKMNVPAEAQKAMGEYGNGTDKYIIQAVFDESNDKIIAMREVYFDTMSEKLNNLLSANNGVLILD